MKKYGEIKTRVIAGVEMKERYIVIAAIKRDGIVFTGLRHGHIIRDMVECGFLTDINKPVLDQEQGFVDDLGNYIPRPQATAIAVEAGQVKEGHGTLYSEDLW